MKKNWKRCSRDRRDKGSKNWGGFSKLLVRSNNKMQIGKEYRLHTLPM